MSLKPTDAIFFEDPHHERRFSPQLSTFPTNESLYGFVQVILRPSSDNGLNKLHIASRSCDLLVVSSLRLDTRSVNLGAHAIHFEPTSETRIFLHKQSIKRANVLFSKENVVEASKMPFLYQLKQVRSKFDQLATYSRCRVSCNFLSHLENQSCNIWTLADHETTRKKPSQTRLGSIIFQKLAISVVRNGDEANLNTTDLPDAEVTTKEKGIEVIIKNIKKLGQHVPIIGNGVLNDLLIDLASSLSTDVKSKNE